MQQGGLSRHAAALAEPVPRPASTRRRRCRRRSRSRPSHRWPRSRQLRGPCRQQPGREVQRGGLSRPALAEPMSRPARTSLRRCRRRSRSRPSHRWPRSRQLRGPCRQQPGRGVQRGGLSRPAQAEPVTPPARTSLRRCRRCGESCLSRCTPRQLAPAALLAVRAAPAVASSIQNRRRGAWGNHTRGVLLTGVEAPQVTGGVYNAAPTTAGLRRGGEGLFGG